MKIVRKSKKAKQPERDKRSSLEIDQEKRELMKKKRKDRIKRRLTVFLFLVACVAIIVAVLKAPIFNVKTAYCVGQQRLTEAEILEIAKVETGKNIFSTNVRAVKKRLGDNPEIAESNVRRIFPNKIKIWIKEAQAVAFAQQEEKLLMIDSEGKIIRVISGDEAKETPAAARIEGVEIVSQTPGERITADGDMRARELFRCIGILSELDMIDKINYINFEDLSNIHVDYEGRLYMLLGSYENLEYKLKFSKKVIDKNISEYEKALFDYRGEKLYVGPREDPDKVDEPIKQEEENPENQEVTEDSAEALAGTEDETSEQNNAQE